MPADLPAADRPAADLPAVAGVTLRIGLPNAAREAAAGLFLEAFGPKVRATLGRGERARRLVAEALRLHRAVGAFGDGRLIGLAGWQDPQGGFLDVDYAALARVYGALGGLWRAAALSVFDRPEEPGVLTLNGVAVAAAWRGRGVGRMLMAQIDVVARLGGAARVRLDVVAGNDGARALYERCGYRAVADARAPWLRPLTGFAATTRMEKAL
jgi:ribosomal protein S18 acetylase RimI-like enzyme